MDTNETVLLTRQSHEAEKAGHHYDIRIVIGDKAYSWATRKDMPEPGKAIILHEQPVHTSDYALSKRVEIPSGQYGGGVTTLDWVRKAKLKKAEDHYILESGDERYLLKHVPKYGEKQWLFKRLDGIEKKATLLRMWSHDESTRTTWLPEGENPGHRWFKTKNVRHAVDRNAYLEKIAEKYRPQPHHEDALSKLDSEGGAIAFHSLGSGKTGLALEAIRREQEKNPKAKALVIAPASLTTNIEREAKKLGIDVDLSKVKVLSYEKATKEADKLKKEDFDITVADEAHRLRSTDTQRSKQLSGLLAKSKKRLLLTATPVYNHASDIAPLVNIAYGEKVLPEDRTAFDAKYIEKIKEQPPILKRILGAEPKEISRLKNQGDLKAKLKWVVSHYDAKTDPKMKDKFPKQSKKIIEVEMDDAQRSLYRYAENQLPLHMKLKVRMGMPVDKRDTAKLNAFLSSTRQISNSVRGFMPNYAKSSPKIKTAIENLVKSHSENPDHKTLVYSNYLDSGINDYSKELTNLDIPHEVYHGALNKSQKDEIVKRYNEGKNKILLISSSGSEGISLKGTRKVQLLEPFWHKSKLDQVEGRASRFGSHDHLPEKERHVEVEEYHSVFSKNMFGKRPGHSVDTYLHHNSKHKDDLNKQITSLVEK